MEIKRRRTINLVPLDRQKFGDWTAHLGATVILTQDIAVPEWAATDATRIQISGGTATLKYFIGPATSMSGLPYTESIWVKNTSAVTMRFGANPASIHVDIAPGESKQYSLAFISTGQTAQLRFETLNAADSLDFITWHPQLEQNIYATSFTTNTRRRRTLSL